MSIFTGNQQLTPTTHVGILTMNWEQILKDAGLDMSKGTARWLIYGHEDREIGNSEPNAAVSSIHMVRKKRLSPRQKAKQAVWNDPLPVTEETVCRDEWGFAGGYTSEGKRTRVGPNQHRHKEIRERQDCSKIAVHSRSRKSTR